MPSQITNYQCPSCMGPLHYAGASGKLECEYCGSSFTVQEIEALYAEQNEQAEQAAVDAEQEVHSEADYEADWDCDAAGSEWGAEAAGMKQYSCPSCGAELICDATTAATSCPYCGNPSVVPGQFQGGLKPDYILPFKLSKEDAVSALRSYYKGKHLLPKAFADSNHIEEIKGVYVPFWLFNGEADVDMRFAATRVYTSRRGDRRITETDHFDVRRGGTVAFSRIPVDASTKMPDSHMDAIEPFDYAQLRPFSTAYLPGYLADIYDVEARDCARHADERATNTAGQIVESSVSGFTTCTPVSQRVRLRRGRVDYALLPVWMLSTRWNGKSFLFAMNGQSGKLIGDLPVSRGRYWARFAGVAAPIAAVLLALQYLL
ncbi:MAG: hypothetical protein IJ594_00770 [Oscillospiraceae bacterium]|nr:hypothetical protein [Oscillospiraceae bacterium]